MEEVSQERGEEVCQKLIDFFVQNKFENQVVTLALANVLCVHCVAGNMSKDVFMARMAELFDQIEKDMQIYKRVPTAE